MNHVPTPKEITAECLAIQAEWTEAERWRRAGRPLGPPVWLPPGVPADGLLLSDLAALCDPHHRPTGMDPPAAILRPES